jgi:Kef-type K+ transport system membrane component KefB
MSAPRREQTWWDRLLGLEPALDVAVGVVLCLLAVGFLWAFHWSTALGTVLVLALSIASVPLVNRLIARSGRRLSARGKMILPVAILGMALVYYFAVCPCQR